MSVLGSSLLSGLSLSRAEQAFRPWWDNVEDHVVYSLVILSLIVTPTTFFMSTGVDCTYCYGNECNRLCWNSCVNDEDTNAAHALGPYNLYFVKQYCSKKVTGSNRYSGDNNDPHSSSYTPDGLAIDEFYMYFPYILLLISGVLVIVDRPFVMILFKSFNIDQLHKLLVVNDPFTENLDKKKETNELLSVLGATSGYYTSYLFRTVLSLACSMIPLAIISIELTDDWYRGRWMGSRICRVQSRYYQCAGYPDDFYRGVGIFYAVLLSLYFLLNIWNLIWIFSPCLSQINGIMARFRESNPGTHLEKLYYRNRNVRLLMGLLSSSSGIGCPLRSLALMEPRLNDALVPTVQILQQTTSGIPGTILRFSIHPRSMLEMTIKSSRCYVSFCLEFEKEAVNFPSFKGFYDVPMAMSHRAFTPFTISTSINGKIVATKKFDNFNGLPVQTNVL